jgi:hypothetical protein
MIQINITFYCEFKPKLRHKMTTDDNVKKIKKGLY